MIKPTAPQILRLVSAMTVIAAALVASAWTNGQELTQSSEASPRSPVPAPAELIRATREIESVFAKQIVSAKLPHQKTALARSLLATATTTSDDVASRYALLQQAIRVATEAGSVAVAYQAIEAMDASFESTYPIKEKAKVCTRASSTSFPLTTAKEILDRTLEDVTAAIDTDSFEEATLFVEAGIIAAKRQNSSSVSDLELLRSEIELMSQEFAAYSSALAEIEMGRGTPEHHKTAGYYLALNKHDWVSAEQHLAIAGEAALRSLVVKEFLKPADILAQVQLADSWWQLSETLPRLQQLEARGCASFWYTSAIAGTEGLTKRKVQDRLATMPPLWKSRRKLSKSSAPATLTGRSSPPPSAPKPTPSAPKLTEVIPLLANPREHAKRGTWEVTDGELVPRSSRAILSLPVSPKENYKLSLELYRASGNEVVLFTLPVAKRQVYIELSCHRGRYNAMSFVKGRHSDNNGTASSNSMLKNGEWNRIDLGVTVDGDNCNISCSINDKQAVQWQGEWRDLGIDGNWGPASETQIGLASVDPGVRFRKLRLSEQATRVPGAVGEGEAIRSKVSVLLADAKQKVPAEYAKAFDNVATEVATGLGTPEAVESLQHMMSAYARAIGVCSAPGVTSDAIFEDIAGAIDAREKMSIAVRYSVAEGVIAWYHFDPTFQHFIEGRGATDSVGKDIVRQEMQMTLAVLVLAKKGRLFLGLPYEVDVVKARKEISEHLTRLKGSDLK